MLKEASITAYGSIEITQLKDYQVFSQVKLYLITYVTDMLEASILKTQLVHTLIDFDVRLYQNRKKH